MPRGARVDLRASEKALGTLARVYAQDLGAGEISDDAIEAVTTVVRSLQGALEKIANEVNENFCGGNPEKSYFPIWDDRSKFPRSLEKNMPGLQAAHPQIAAAIERQQPYHPNQRQLARLKPLYRENHHHDFSKQTLQQSVSWEKEEDGKVVAAIHSRALDVSPSAVLFQGVPAAIQKGREGNSKTDWVDWVFDGLDGASVWGTLRILHNLCVSACFEVWASTDL